ncbi:MAG TPA: ketopantoate reductase C-terminal domain-containing protein [Alphaproteobacteria bacterium]
MPKPTDPWRGSGDPVKPIEAEAILGQVQAFARQARVATPTIDVILPLLRGLDRALRGGG